jgi:hypothetical protein
MKSICEWSELLYKDVTETPNIIPIYLYILTLMGSR